MVLSTPALDEGHPDGAHLGQLVHCLEPVGDGLGEQGGELLVVEDLQAAAGRDLADCGWVKAVMVITVPRLDEDGRVREALSVHLAPHVVEVNTLADVAPGVLYGGVPVDIGELAQTEPVTRRHHLVCCVTMVIIKCGSCCYFCWRD